MNPDSKKSSQDEGVIEVRLLKAGSRFALDVYDEDDNLILNAHTPLSESLLNHLKISGIQRLSYDPSKLKGAKGEAAHPLIISEQIRNETYDHTRNLLEEIRDTFSLSPGAGISKNLIEKSRGMVDKLLSESAKIEDGIFDTVVKLKDMDDYYYQHSTNVAILASILATRLDFRPELKMAMGVGGLFHDIGFSSVSKDILYKAKLTNDEFDIIKGHTQVGYKFVENNPNFHDIEKRILLLHHERADGGGYPYGFELDHYRDSIPREIRLASLIDVYVSLTMAKPDEKALSSREALRAMVNMIYAPYKTVFRFLDTDVRDFIRGLGFILNKGDYFMKPGDLVRVSSGEIGIVQEMNRFYPMNPKVLIVKNERMEKLKRPIVVDLLKTFKDHITNLYDRDMVNHPADSEQSRVDRT